MELFKATYALPQTVISEGQALTRFIVTPDLKIALKLADDNMKGLELAKVELAEKDVITFAEERDAWILILVGLVVMGIGWEEHGKDSAPQRQDLISLFSSRCYPQSAPLHLAAVVGNRCKSQYFRSNGL
jgi:hypothetical protein